MNSDHTLDVSKERPFSCLERPSSLQILAASKIAFRLWLNKYHVQDGDKRGCWTAPISFSKSSVFSCKDMFALPTRIRDMIDEYIYRVGKEIKMWDGNLRKAMLQFSDRYVKDKQMVEIFVKCFDGIVFKPNGDIYFQSSARKALTMEELDARAKFRIACKFCLVDEIKEIWPSVSQTRNLFDNSTLMRYWEHTLKNNFIATERFVGEQLADSVKERNWAAFGYFWDMLSEERQTVEAIAILRKSHFNRSRRVLLKLNEKQVREVSRQFASIFIELIWKQRFFAYAIPLWTCMKNIITGPVFLSILLTLWRRVFNPGECRLRDVKLNSTLLRELWSSAPDSLKSFVSVRELFAELDGDIRDISYFDSTFMCEVLENASHDLKNEIWTSNWYKILIRANISDIKKIMELCSVNDHEMDLSKEFNSSKLELLRGYFNFLVKYGLYSELCEFLGFFVKDPNRLETLSKELIFTNLHHISVCDEEALAMLRSFIHFTFSTTVKANEFIEEFVASPEGSTWIHNKLDDRCYDDVVNLCIRFPLPYEDSMQNMKHALLMYCYSNFANGRIMEFDARKFTKFSYWCCNGGGNELAEFKREINIDDVFQSVLDDLMRELIESKTLNGAVFSKFEEFLVCFFVNMETYRAYKSARMLVYKDCELVKFALRDDVLAPRVQFLLNWGMGVGNDADESCKWTRVPDNFDFEL